MHLAKIEELAITKNHFIIVAQRIFPKIKVELRKRNSAYLEAKKRFNEKLLFAPDI
ncbi:hypothetical protein D3C80_1247370 [compost metagenome]